MRRRQVGVLPALAACGRSLLLDQVIMDAGLKLAQGRDVRIRVMIRRHARLGFPSTAEPRCTPRSGPGLLLPIADSSEIGRSVNTLALIV